MVSIHNFCLGEGAGISRKNTKVCNEGFYNTLKKIRSLKELTYVLDLGFCSHVACNNVGITINLCGTFRAIFNKSFAPLLS